jgi:prepilin-type N-terminal cleavage/methylation domain-containing protein
MAGRTLRRSAFTLVELLVVIGIIAVLIGILMPALSKARKQSKAIQCQSNLRQFGMGIEMYAATFRGVMPFKGPDGSSTSATNKNFFGSATSGCIGYVAQRRVRPGTKRKAAAQ